MRKDKNKNAILALDGKGNDQTTQGKVKRLRNEFKSRNKSRGRQIRVQFTQGSRTAWQSYLTTSKSLAQIALKHNANKKAFQ